MKKKINYQLIGLVLCGISLGYFFNDWLELNLPSYKAIDAGTRFVFFIIVLFYLVLEVLLLISKNPGLHFIGTLFGILGFLFMVYEFIAIYF